MSGTSPASPYDMLQNQVTGSILLNVIENTAKLNKKTTGSSAFSEELKTLQTKVSQMSSTVAQASADATAAKSTANSASTKAEEASSAVDSMQSAVQALQTTVGDDSSGLVKEVVDVEDNVNSLISVVGSTENDGLRKTVSDLQTTVGDETDGLVKDVTDLQTAIANVPTTDAVVLKNPAEAQTISNDLTLSNGKLTIGSSTIDDTLLTVNGNAQFGNYIKVADSYIRSRSNGGVIFSRDGSEGEGLFNYLNLNASRTYETLHVESDTNKIRFHNNIQMTDLESFTVGESGSPANKITLNAAKIELRNNDGYVYLNGNDFHMGNNNHTLNRLVSYSDSYDIKRGSVSLGEESFRTNLTSYGNINATNFTSNYYREAYTAEMGRLDATEKYGSMLLRYNNGTAEAQNLDTMAIRPSEGKVLNINGIEPFKNEYAENVYPLSNSNPSVSINEVISSAKAGAVYHFQFIMRQITFTGTTLPIGHDEVEIISTTLNIKQNEEVLVSYRIRYGRFSKVNDTTSVVGVEPLEGSFITTSADPVDIQITMSDFDSKWTFTTSIWRFSGYSYDSSVTLNTGNITATAFNLPPAQDPDNPSFALTNSNNNPTITTVGNTSVNLGGGLTITSTPTAYGDSKISLAAQEGGDISLKAGDDATGAGNVTIEGGNNVGITGKSAVNITSSGGKVVITASVDPDVESGEIHLKATNGLYINGPTVTTDEIRAGNDIVSNKYSLNTIGQTLETFPSVANLIVSNPSSEQTISGKDLKITGGNLYIGNPASASDLTVQGSIIANQITTQDSITSGGDLTAVGNLTLQGNSILFGNTTIGTNSSNANLNVYGNITTNRILTTDICYSSNQSTPLISFEASGVNIGAMGGSLDVNMRGNTHISDGTLTVNGNVTVGSTDSTADLTVNGTLTADMTSAGALTAGETHIGSDTANANLTVHGDITSTGNVFKLGNLEISYDETTSKITFHDLAYEKIATITLNPI